MRRSRATPLPRLRQGGQRRLGGAACHPSIAGLDPPAAPYRPSGSVPGCPWRLCVAARRCRRRGDPASSRGGPAARPAAPPGRLLLVRSPPPRLLSGQFGTAARAGGRRRLAQCPARDPGRPCGGGAVGRSPVSFLLANQPASMPSGVGAASHLCRGVAPARSWRRKAAAARPVVGRFFARGFGRTSREEDLDCGLISVK